uniref:Major facilitator superfamily (MFS) profile domain-containing protein n=1 Tax=Plectus sambesii TaxID=2011161 RepID=A0A914X463_9BILA
MGDGRTVRLVLITVASALVGSFQIYNQAIVNNLVPAFAPWLAAVQVGGDVDFDWYWSLVVAAYPFGKFLGTLISGKLADGLGRINALALDSTLLLIGGLSTLLSGGLRSVWTLIFGRALIGVAAGIGWIVGALLIAEITTVKNRGSILSILGICFGVGVASGTALSLPKLLGTTRLWPLAMSLGAFIGAPIFIALPFFIPESPRHLILMRNNCSEGVDSILFYQGEMHVTNTVEDLIEEREKYVDRGGRLARDSAYWRALFLSCLLMAANVLVGVTVFISFGTLIMQSAGFSYQTASYLSLFFASMEITSVLPMTVFVDAYGRRPLIIYGYAFSAVTTFFLAVMISMPPSTTQQLAILISLGIAWISTALPCAAGACVVTELFPQTTRAEGMVISRSFMWLLNAITAATFLPTYRLFGAFWATSPFFIGTCIIVIILHYILPETKGKTFAEIANQLTEPEHHQLLDQSTISFECYQTSNMYRCSFDSDFSSSTY